MTTPEVIEAKHTRAGASNVTTSYKAAFAELAEAFQALERDLAAAREESERITIQRDGAEFYRAEYLKERNALKTQCEELNGEIDQLRATIHAHAARVDAVERVGLKLMRTCYDEANRISNHCSDGAARSAGHYLYEAANEAKAILPPEKPARERIGG